ncbi:MAG: hypothetical protein HYR76_01725 [Ignavibacteria bacterium]|nr:hypothetical protein [Ignavibacteria bacterium]
MKRPYPSTEFEATVAADGSLTIPEKIARGLKNGSFITIRLTEGVVSRSLHRKGVSEDEIEQIATLQLEERNHVLRFLEAEGALAHDRKLAARASGLLRRDR